MNLPVASPRCAARPMPSSERFHVSKEREHAGHPSFVSPCHMASRNARPTRAQVNGGGQECPPLHDLGDCSTLLFGLDAALKGRSFM